MGRSDGKDYNRSSIVGYTDDITFRDEFPRPTNCVRFYSTRSHACTKQIRQANDIGGNRLISAKLLQLVKNSV